MKNPLSRYGLVALLCGVVLLQTQHSIQAEGAKAPAAANTGEEGSRPTPYTGRILSIDPDSRTVTLSGKKPNRILIVTARSKIIKDGAPATLKDAKVGDEIGGQLRTFPDGRHEAVSLRIGPKPESPEKTGSKKGVSR